MSDTPKIRLVEAAKIVGVHQNTLRNWRKAGKLKTVEKIFENGIEVWYVDLSEVQRLYQQTNTHLTDTQSQVFGGTNEDQSLPSGSVNTNQLDIMRELLVTPLTELIKEQQTQITNMAMELGELRATINQLKEARILHQDGPQAENNPPKVETHTQEFNTAQNASNDVQTPPKKLKWWERWL